MDTRKSSQDSLEVFGEMNRQHDNESRFNFRLLNMFIFLAAVSGILAQFSILNEHFFCTGQMIRLYLLLLSFGMLRFNAVSIFRGLGERTLCAFLIICGFGLLILSFDCVNVFEDLELKLGRWESVLEPWILIGFPSFVFLILVFTIKNSTLVDHLLIIGTESIIVVPMIIHTTTRYLVLQDYIYF